MENKFQQLKADVYDEISEIELTNGFINY